LSLIESKSSRDLLPKVFCIFISLSWNLIMFHHPLHRRKIFH
jgi:hypothetical protein